MTEPIPPAAPDTSNASTDADFAAFLAWKAAGQPSAPAVPATAPAPVPEPAPAPPTFDEITQAARDVFHALIERARYAAENDVRAAKSAIDTWLAK